jgi:hypothetical protein
MFGTEDLVFVPQDGVLILDDVYNWRRIKFDVHHFGLRLRSVAFDEVVDRVRGATKLMEKSTRHEKDMAALQARADAAVRDLAPLSGAGEVAYTGDLRVETRSPEATWWVRISDHPAESYFPEDYDRTLGHAPGEFTCFQTFGSVVLDGLEGLEVAMAGDEDEGLPFVIEVPNRAGIARFTMPTAEPLALIHEFCGVHGVSANGRTVNVDSRGDIVASHQFCTPLGRVGTTLFATLYIHYRTDPGPPVMGRVPDARILEVAATLERSSFTLVSEGPTHRLYERAGDVVHLYSGLPGHEAEGQPTVPSLLVVAAAEGSIEIEGRAALFDAIRESMRG